MSQTQMQTDPAWLGDAPISEANKIGDDVAEAGTRGNWPRMIKLDKETEARLRMWVDNEIEAFYGERQSLLEDWKRWQTLYWAQPAKKERNFPFKRAANIVIPLAAIAVEAIHARMMNTLFSVDPFYSIRPQSKEWIPAAKPFEQYLQTEVNNQNGLNMWDFCNEALLELGKLGTCVGKSGYEKVVKKSLRARGEEEEELFVTVKNGATLDRVPLANFILRFNELDPDTAPIVGEKHRFSWSQLKKFAQTGRMDAEAVNKIKHRWVQENQSGEAGDGAELKQKVDELANTEPQWTEGFDVYELWCSFDVDKDPDGWDEEVVIDYHKESGTFLSIRYNWYDDLHRPYKVCNFLNVEGIWPGIGICKQVEQFQAEATTIHRQRLDNATLANMAQIVLRKNMGYGPGEPVFPGKMWFVDDPTRDVKEFKLSEVYPSSYANEESVVRYFEKRSGVNEVILGMPQEGTPGTATSDLTRLAEGNKRFDLVLKNVRRWLSAIGVDIITNYQIFGNQQAHWLVQGEDGVWTEMVLNMPSILVRRGAIVDLTVTDSITNQDLEQRQWLQLFQVITNYYQQVLQLSQIMMQVTGDPTMFAQIAQRALMSSDEAMRRLLETFRIIDSDRFSLVEENPNADAGTSNGNGATAGGGLTLPLGGNGAPAGNRFSP